MTLSGNIATRENDPETFRQAGFEVNHYRDEVTLNLSDPETGSYLGAVHLEVKGNELRVKLYRADDEPSGVESVLYTWNDLAEEEPDET